MILPPSLLLPFLSLQIEGYLSLIPSASSPSSIIKLFGRQKERRNAKEEELVAKRELGEEGLGMRLYYYRSSNSVRPPSEVKM